MMTDELPAVDKRLGNIEHSADVDCVWGINHGGRGPRGKEQAGLLPPIFIPAPPR
jgi:hypothetical protein